MDSTEKYRLLNKMGKCEVSPSMGSTPSQKYCAAFKIWIGTKWASYQWGYGRTVDGAIDNIWEKLQDELWVFVTQISKHDNN